MTGSISRDEAIGIARRFLDGMADMDFTGVAAMMTDDVRVSMPFTPGGEHAMKGPAGFLEGMSTVPAFLSEIAFTVDAAFYDPEAQRVFLEYHSKGMRADGRPYGNRYIGTWDLRDGKVCGWQEYYNPAQLA